MHWIDPFSGKAIAAPFGAAEIARQYFAENDHWQRGTSKSAEEMRQCQWLHWLKQNIRSDDRLRIFSAAGNWMNPANGVFSQHAKRIGGKVDLATLTAMAADLAQSSAAQPKDLLSLDDLKQRIGAPSTDDDSGVAPIIGEESLSFTTSSGDSTDSLKAPRKTSTSGRLSASGPTPTDSAVGSLRSLYQKVATDHNAETNDDLDRARRVQENMMCKIPDIDGARIAVHYKPYDAIGGDLYEICQLDANRWLFLLGDVTGHGVQAALVTSSMIKALRYITRQEQDLIEIMCALNDSAKEDLISGQFITVWAAIVDVTTGEMETVCAGHHQALLGNPSKDVLLERLGKGGMAIGLAGSGILRKQLHVETYQLEPGDLLVQYTDGISEMMDEAREEFGDFRVMGAFVSHLDHTDPQEVIDGMAAIAELFTGQAPDDDVTLLALKVIDPEAEPNAESDDDNGPVIDGSELA
jgi:serine phosphatase RsbU (regulator of sigma subunit)